MDNLKTLLLEKAKSLPKKPGCYLFKNKFGTVLYVGKSKSLKGRVTTYFNQSKKTIKTEILVGHVVEIEFILTTTEAEAFVLENNLIKKYSPKYNIYMRDDKSYPYVVVDHRGPFPRPKYQRRIKRTNKLDVFGPFVTGSNISEVLRIVVKSLGLRDCSLNEFKSRKTACLLYQLKQCTAPCVDYISEKDYLDRLQLAIDFFDGDSDKTLNLIEIEMLEYADREEFEHAAILRDNLKTLENFVKSSKQENAEIGNEKADLDVFSFHVGDIEVDLAIYIMRKGILLGHKTFHFPLIDVGEEEIEEEIVNFIFQYYVNGHDSLPKKIILDLAADRIKRLQTVFKNVEDDQGLSKIKLRTAGKTYGNLLKLTKQYAREHQRVRIKNQESYYVGLNKLKDLLSLPERPVVLECYDVAIWQGKSPTASQIVFRNGRPVKEKYRYYHLNEVEEMNNDFAMMKEVIGRRVKHGDLPDVFVVDGGKGQLSSFKAVLDDLNIEIPVVAIAKAKVQSGFKKKEIHSTEERLFIPGRLNPFILKKNKALFQILTQMRDEAHRFSRKLHHKKEKNRLTKSWLDEIPGIGQATKQKILKNLDLPIAELARLNADDLAKAVGIKKDLAVKISHYLEEFKSS